MDKIAEIFKFLATTNTINFIIMIGLLYWLVKKMKLGKSFEQGIKNIQSEIEKSDSTKQTSLNHHKEAQNLINGLPNDIKTLENNSAEKIDIFKKQIKENSQKTINNISINIEKSIQIEEKKISNLLTEQTSQNALQQAKTNLEDMLKNNPKLHDLFIEQSIAELEKVTI